MEESSRESQPRCPCGFWGSSKTLGLCSVCYRQAHRNQTQGNTNTSDVGRTGVGNCHSQTQNSQGKRMDSKHFPSRSTADNLPSSLSSPPGERTALSATPASPVDATPATSGGTTASHHSSSVATASVDNQTETTTMTISSCESLLSSDVSDLCSTASSDLSHDSKHDTGSCASDSFASLISVTSSSTAAIPSFATSESNEACINNDCQLAGNQSSIAGVGFRTDIASISSTQSPSDCAKTVGVCADTTVVGNTAASSNKNTSPKTMDTGDRRTNTSTACDINSQASASRTNPLTDTNRSTEPAPGKADISTAQVRGTKRSRDEMEASGDPVPSQKNKKRCYTCSCKLELAQRTIGRCRCDRVFCALHRLPELHQCEFNHKEDGRREAREKMIKPTRHLGPSYRREDHS